jgi:hypothetical protein
MVMMAVHPQLMTTNPTPGTPVPLARRPIPCALRHWILGRDGYQCRAPGCSRGENLDVFHIDPTRPGGRNNPANLVTVCDICQPMWNLMGRGPFVEERPEICNLQEQPTAVNQ